MYKPAFNKVLVEITKSLEDEYGGGNDESMLGKSYSKGKLIKVGYMLTDDKYNAEVLTDVSEQLDALIGTNIMWHEGAEAGTVHDVDGKQYGLIYWYDIVGIEE